VEEGRLQLEKARTQQWYFEQVASHDWDGQVRGEGYLRNRKPREVWLVCQDTRWPVAGLRGQAYNAVLAKTDGIPMREVTELLTLARVYVVPLGKWVVRNKLALERMECAVDRRNAEYVQGLSEQEIAYEEAGAKDAERSLWIWTIEQRK
jgi:hypothetical protein